MADRTTRVNIEDATGTVISPVSTAGTTTEYNVTLTNANTEYSQALPSGTKRFVMQCRTSYDVRWSWTTGKVATPTAPYNTMKAGTGYAEDNLSLSSKTMYLASATAGVIVELTCYS